MCTNCDCLDWFDEDNEDFACDTTEPEDNKHKRGRFD